jgi:hypothetical protein
MRWERVLWTGRGGVRGCVAVPWAGAGLLSALPSVLRAGLLLLREPLRRHVNLLAKLFTATTVLLKQQAHARDFLSALVQSPSKLNNVSLGDFENFV